jgi:competence protein ComEA
VPNLPRHELVAYAALAVVVVLLGARYLRSSAPPQAAAAPASHAVSVAPGGRSAVVDVAGAVHRPGVYELEAGARVLDAVRRAGGARHGANLAAINLAARLADGQQIVVPARVAPASSPTTAPGDPATPSVPVSLGSATLAQLETLDGVGPATAQKIVAYRTQHGGFRSIDDLANVPGIGPKKLAAIRPHVQP